MACCDTLGCPHTRKRWQRLCDRCFSRLPGEIKVGLVEAKHQRRDSDWRRLRVRAAEFMGFDAANRPHPILRSIPPEEAYARNARLLGERP